MNTDWIETKAALPEMGVPVLVVHENKVRLFKRDAALGPEGKWAWFRLGPGLGFPHDSVTHWMPLPALPK